MISTNIIGAAAYAAIQGGLGATSTTPTLASSDSTFGNALQSALTGLSELGANADAKSVQAMSGKGNMTDVVMAVNKAEMAIQGTVAVRDKVVSAYQEIMRMAV